VEIQRIDGYEDPRFSQDVLAQHGAFVCDGECFGFEIIGKNHAIIHSKSIEVPDILIDEFRFYAEHIDCFYNDKGQLIKQFNPVELFAIDLRQIQPSQFFVDEDKVRAVSSFIHSTHELILPLTLISGKYVSLDGHSRMVAAIQKGISHAMGYLTPPGDYIETFVQEAKARMVFSPYDLKALSHADYQVQWDKFCDDFFSRADEKESG
jgi:hypothetical protein